MNSTTVSLFTALRRNGNESKNCHQSPPKFPESWHATVIYRYTSLITTNVVTIWQQIPRGCKICSFFNNISPLCTNNPLHLMWHAFTINIYIKPIPMQTSDGRNPYIINTMRIQSTATTFTKTIHILLQVHFHKNKMYCFYSKTVILNCILIVLIIYILITTGYHLSIKRQHLVSFISSKLQIRSRNNAV